MSAVTDYWGSQHVTSNFGDARPNGRKHRGTDYSHGNGTPIPSPLAGTVVGTLAPATTHGFGYQVTIKAASGETYSFAHMQSKSRFGVGARVAVGDILGYEGRTGATTGPCTHVEYNNGGFSNPAPRVASLIAGGSGPAAGGGGFSQDTKNRQEWLTALGISVGASGADGLEGDATRAGYKVYQQDLKTNWGYTGEIDGVWGDGTQAAHQRKYDSMQAPAPAPALSTTGRPTLSRGAKGQLVLSLQNRLNERYPAYSSLRPDGDFGGATEKVVKEFQRRSGLDTDGIVGSKTWGALGL